MCEDRRFRFEYASVDEEVFESGKNKLRIKKYQDTCGRGLIRLIRI